VSYLNTGNHDIELSPMRRLIGGNLRANDPRQFLVEVMVGAVHADGVVDRREQEALHKILAEHALFAGLPARAAPALLELASDAMYFAGGVDARLVRIAAALPWRLHRLAAYAMACELVASDEVIAADEESYLRSLRRSLMVGSDEAAELLDGARRRQALSTLDQLSGRCHDFIEKAVRLTVALRRNRDRLAPGDNLVIERSYRSMLDFADALMVPREKVERMAIELPAQSGDLCIEMCSRISDPADRYWALAYSLAVEAINDNCRSWRDSALLRVLRLAFEMSERAMDRCEAHAGRITELSRR
jgi:uncharacterized tellurite resistance protein B-like protein